MTTVHDIVRSVLSRLLHRRAADPPAAPPIGAPPGPSPGGDGIERLAGGIAHDLNNILLVVRGFIELALAEGDLGLAAKGHLQEVTSVLSRASELVEQLLAVGRRVSSSPADVEVNEVVGRMLEQSRACHGGVQVSFVAGTALPHLHAPAEQVERCIRGLIGFLMERIPEGGRLSIETRHGAAGRAAGRVVLHLAAPDAVVADDELAHLFEPFYASSQYTGRRLGLALAAARGTVSLLGGEISARAMALGGIEIVAAFPARRESAPVSAVESGGTILLAEDDAGIRELASRALAKEGFRVLAAGDGEEAAGIFERNRDLISIAILDDVMPKQSGRAVLEQIRRIRPSLPVVLCTGYAWGGRDSAARPGFEEILAKPYEPRDLLRSVRRLLGNSG
jgi:two-component system, cell cycle sensor histidine kinase and response regulator CckA